MNYKKKRLVFFLYLIFCFNGWIYSQSIVYNSKKKFSNILDKCIYFFLTKDNVERVYFDKKILYQFKYYKLKDFKKFISLQNEKEIALSQVIREFFYVDTVYKKNVGLVKNLLLDVKYNELSYSKSPSLIYGINPEAYLNKLVSKESKIAIPGLNPKKYFLLIKPLEPIKISSNSFLMPFLVFYATAYKCSYNQKWIVEPFINPPYINHLDNIMGLDRTDFYVFTVIFKKGEARIVKTWVFEPGWWD